MSQASFGGGGGGTPRGSSGGFPPGGFPSGGGSTTFLPRSATGSLSSPTTHGELSFKSTGSSSLR
jgi:hypothetical protein